MIVIVAHQNPDFDAVAAMVAVQKIYPGSIKVIVGTPERNVSAFLEKFSHFFYFENEKNISLGDVSMIVMVDTQSPSRIGKFKTLIEESSVPVHIYDHHPKKADGVDPDVFVFRQVGATVTMLVDIIKRRGLNITPEEATLMMLGIYEETNIFRYVSTTPADLDAASSLLTFGADVSLAATYMNQEMNEELTDIFTTLLNSMEFFSIQGFTVSLVSALLPRYVPHISFLVHKVREIENVGIVFALIEMEGKVYLICRSNNPLVNVAEVARHFGGGGHAYAAFAIVRDQTHAHTRDQLIEYLHKTLKLPCKAKDIMSSPVLSIAPDQTAEYAKQYMVKRNINTLPVVKDHTLLGILTRMDLDKAIHHALHDAPVQYFMHTDLVTISVETDFSHIQQIFRKTQFGRVPVMENDRLVGIITRTDLLRALHDNYLQFSHKEQREHQTVISYISHDQFEEALAPDVVALIDHIGQLAQQHNINVFVVGGFVRDILLKRKNFDIDIVVEGNGIQFAKILADSLGGTVATHHKFATAVVVLSSGIRIDIATARLEYYDSPGALPTIELASIKHDLSRRDFTINAMAIRINTNAFGELIDFFGGQQDLKNGIVRVLHNLSFVEDPTRIFRAVRFEQRFGFRIEKHTENLIKHAVKQEMFQYIAFDRIRHELILMLSEPNPIDALRRLYEFDELKFIDSSFQGKPIPEELFMHIKECIAWYHLSFFKTDFKSWLVYFLGMLSRLRFKYVFRVCKTLNMKKNDVMTVIETFRQRNMLLRILEKPIKKNSFLYRQLNGLNDETLVFIMAESNSDAVKEKISYFMLTLKQITLSVSGDDVINKGLKPSPAVGKILKILHAEKLDGKISDKKVEAARLEILIDAYKHKKYNNADF